MKSINKLLFASFMALGAVGLTSCNTETTITDLPVDATSAAIFNYGTNTVLFKIPVKDVQWANEVSVNDFEFDNIAELSGKKFSSLTRKSDTEVEGTFTGKVADLKETKHLSVNIKTSAFKGKTKVAKAHADIDLMRAFVKCYGQTAQTLESGKINYYAEFQIYGAPVFKFGEQTTTLTDAEVQQAFITEATGEPATKTQIKLYTNYKTWGSQYFDIGITNATIDTAKVVTDKFDFVLNKSNIQAIAPNLKDVKLKLNFDKNDGISPLSLTASDIYFEKGE